MTAKIKELVEKTDSEKKRTSLENRFFQNILTVCVVLVVASLLLFFVTTSQSIAVRLLNQSEKISKNAYSVLELNTNPSQLATQIHERYLSIPEEVRKNQRSKEYLDYFSDIYRSDDYRKTVAILEAFQDSGELDDIYLALYDEQTENIVVVADPDGTTNAKYNIGMHIKIEDQYVRQALDVDTPYLSFITRNDGQGLVATGGIKIMDSNGKIVGHILVNLSLENILHRTIAHTLQYGALMVVLALILAYVLAKSLSNHLIRPINQITETSEKYSKAKMQGERNTHYFSDIEITSNDEIERLWEVMKDMEEDLGDYDERLTAEASEKQKMATELDLATQIQSDTLPNIFPPFPEHYEFDIYATMTPARQVGGDFYDFYFIDEDHLAMVIADVSGKGIPAALFMMQAKLLIQNYALSTYDPASILEQVNNRMCESNEVEMFVTAWLGILDVHTGKLVAANAGHEYPIIKQPNQPFEVLKDTHGFVMGGLSDRIYTNYSIDLEPGSVLFVYTDGLPEAENENHEFFGIDRVLDVLNTSQVIDANQLLNRMTDEVRVFQGKTDQFDDLTMLCMRYLGQQENQDVFNPGIKSIQVISNMDSIRTVTDFVNKHLGIVDCPAKIKKQIDIVIDEVLSNIVYYAYDNNNGPIKVSVELSEDHKTVKIIFEDQGIPYNPLEKEDPDISLGLQERQVGGLGVFLVKKMMDDVSYRYDNNTNHLILTKRIHD